MINKIRMSLNNKMKINKWLMMKMKKYFQMQNNNLLRK